MRDDDEVETGLMSDKRGGQVKVDTEREGLCWVARALRVLLGLFLLGLVGTVFNLQQGTSTDGSPTSPERSAVSPAFKSLFAQGRWERRVGLDKARFKIENHDTDHLFRQQQRFDAIQQLRLHTCGDFEAYLRGDAGKDSLWTPVIVPANDKYHNHEQDEYCRGVFSACVPANTTRHVCHAPHPRIPGAVVTIERVGPWNMLGRYDWARMGASDMGNLEARYMNRSFSVLGGMFAPTFANGTIIGYPPLHVHHAHLMAYANSTERFMKNIGSVADQVDAHHVLVQTHGDSECKREEGGLACLYRELQNPEEEGHLVQHDQSGFWMDFELNNVRDQAVRGVFMDVVLTHRDSVPAKPVTYYHVGSGLFGAGPGTYDIPADPSRTVMWHTMPLRFAGTMRDFHVHTHQAMFDSMFVFKGANAFAALEPFRRGQLLPLVIDCDDRWPSTDGDGGLARAKREMLAAVRAAQDVELICEVAKPSLLLENCDGPEGDPRCRAFDKRVAANCVDSIHVDIGDAVVVLAFNHARNLSTTSRRDERFMKDLRSYDFALKQHSLFRSNVVHDANFTLEFAPPAYYEYALTPYDLMTGPHAPHLEITAACPPSITFNMSISLGEWTHFISGQV